jgi:corrinoid protein of di/trimethylamine methyltransferase
MVQAVIDGEKERAVELAQEALRLEVPPLEAIDKGYVVGIQKVGELFEKGDFFLPEMMLAAQAMQEALELLDPYLERQKVGREEKGMVVIGTVEGDIHEIGKNIVALLLKVNGFTVYDLGPDVNALDFIKRAQEMKADIIGASALMTTTMPGQGEIVELLKDMGLRDRFHVTVGGTPVTQEWAEEIGADSWAENATRAVAILEKAMKERRGHARATL